MATGQTGTHVGTWVSDETGRPHLTLTDDGKVRGSDGCNRIVSTYTVEDGVVDIAWFVTTLMACPGVVDWLGGVATLRIEGDTAIVFNRRNEEIGALTRSAEDPEASHG